MIKTDLTSFDNLGRQAFPRPGVLKHRTSKEQEAILADPAAFFGDPKEVDTLDRHDDILDVSGHVTGRVPVYKKVLADPCPRGARGFGWWPEVDQSATLGIGETHGAETLTVDPANKRWIVTRAVIAAAPVEVSAHYDALEKSLHRSIDEAAEQRRLDFITNGAGQAATYTRVTPEPEIPGVR